MAAVLQLHPRRTIVSAVRACFRVAIGVLAPAMAEACPACAADNRDGAVLTLVGLFLLVPFALAALVFVGLRRLPPAAGDQA